MVALSLPSRNSQRGISLIEILVGAAVALIGIAVIFQVLSVSETRKRTTMAGSDAQIAGSTALFALERDVKLAGFGFGHVFKLNLGGCSVQAWDQNRPGNVLTFPLLPVTITQGLNGAPDTISVLYGNSSYFTDNQAYTNATATTAQLQNRGGVQLGDLVILADASAPGLCAMSQVTNYPDGVTIGFAQSSGYVDFYQNPTGMGTTSSEFSNPAGVSGLTSGYVFDMGPKPRRNVWQIINNRTLSFSNDFSWVDTTPADGVNDFIEVADDIVDMQAQYGVDLNGDGMITGALEWQDAPNAVDLPKTLAIRVALLARSEHFEKDVVTTSAPTWSGGTFVMKNIDGTTAALVAGDPNNWQNYRYRVYEATISLRNILW